MAYQADSSRYDRMSYKNCGNSGLKLPLISLGLWHNFGDVDEVKKYKKILFTAFDFGITHFDLANNYGPPPGSAERNFGKVLHNQFKSHRDELIISTKAGYRMWPGPYGEWGSRKYLISSLDQSLCRMRLEYVDIFYSHRYDPNTPLEETMEALASIYRAGKALYIGISNYPAEQTKQAIQILKDKGVSLTIYQPKYSMLHREPELGLLSVLEKEKIGCIPFSPLAQGLLTDRYLKGIPKNSRISKKHGFLQESALSDQVLAIISQLNSMAIERGQTLSQMALAWLLNKPSVTSVLIGASSYEQLKINLESMHNLKFSRDESEKIEKILANNHFTKS